MLFKHIKLDSSTRKISLKFKSKTNTISKSYFLKHSVFFDILSNLYASKTDSNQRMFNLVKTGKLSYI